MPLEAIIGAVIALLLGRSGIRGLKRHLPMMLVRPADQPISPDQRPHATGLFGALMQLLAAIVVAAVFVFS